MRLPLQGAGDPQVALNSVRVETEAELALDLHSLNSLSTLTQGNNTFSEVVKIQGAFLTQLVLIFWLNHTTRK